MAGLLGAIFQNPFGSNAYNPYEDDAVGSANKTPSSPRYHGTTTFPQTLPNPALQQAYADYQAIREQQEIARLIDTAEGRDRMIAMRMGWVAPTKNVFQFMTTALVGDEVFVIFIVKGEVVSLKDERAMFPSDKLITSLRLLTP